MKFKNIRFQVMNKKIFIKIEEEKLFKISEVTVKIHTFVVIFTCWKHKRFLFFI